MAVNTLVPDNPRHISGVPAKFIGWRIGQKEAVQECLTCFRPGKDHKRFIAQAQPTGSGKSLAYISSALLSGYRTIILTNTKGLQDQITAEFRGVVTDIRGRNSYKCRISSRYNCAEGPCRYGFQCEHKEDSSCPYLAAVREASRSKVVITNYAYWLNIGRLKESPIGNFDLLVLDEAHESDAALMSFLTVTISSRLLKKCLKESLPTGYNIGWWRGWATTIRSIAKERLTQEIDKWQKATKVAEIYLTPEMKDLESIISSVEALLDNVCLDWLIVYNNPKDGDDQSAVFFPVKLRYAETENHLFRGIKQVILTSATLSPKTLTLLDIPLSESKYSEYPSTFPVKNRPIYIVPSVKLKYGQPLAELLYWLKTVDKIIDGRLDRKGIIHTHSFAMRDFIFKNSRHRKLFYTNQSGNTASVVEAFKSAQAPAILLSPSMVSGWDFPLDQCRYQIVAKVPFPSLGDPMLIKRAEVDKELTHYITMQHLIQCCGRGVRSETDSCETFVVDGNMQWWYARFFHFAPKWFRAAMIKCTSVPVPLQMGTANLKKV